MDINSFYHVCFNCELKTKEEVYTFIADMVCRDNPSQKEEIVNQLYQRENVGSILIAEHVMLPHMESDLIEKSQIVFIHLANPIQSWDEQTKDIRLFIVILLKENEQEQIKKRISLFTRTLADEAYLNRLLCSNDKEAFNQELIKI
ncbi:PTS sugar transporter subunit IIA [Ornithinibacillus sp. FSL M8-0202]|uniref:PTS sugar transporter subunit IIA n=1 Tax=Ornithinibacillus sp. FSL M8-0202 TaxID=2921616 RepID=UPI0030D3859D